MILRPLDEQRLLKLLYDYARNRSSEATLEDLLAYMYHRGVRVSVATLKRKLDKFAKMGLVSIGYRQHYLELCRDGRRWFLPVKRRIYVIRTMRISRVLEEIENIGRENSMAEIFKAYIRRRF